MRSYSGTSKSYFFDFPSFMETWKQDIKKVTVTHALNTPIIEQDIKICAKINNNDKLIQKYCELFSDRNQINQEQIKLLESFELCAEIYPRSKVDLIRASKGCIDDAFKSHDLAVRYEALLIETIEVTKTLAFQENDEL